MNPNLQNSGITSKENFLETVRMILNPHDLHIKNESTDQAEQNTTGISKKVLGMGFPRVEVNNNNSSVEKVGFFAASGLPFIQARCYRAASVQFAANLDYPAWLNETPNRAAIGENPDFRFLLMRN